MKNEKWVPPRSPHNIIQEDYWPDEWKVLVCCLLLNQTNYRKVRPILPSFFERWPDPQSLLRESDETIKSFIQPLGMQNRRTKTLKKFSQQFLENEWLTAKQLYGCGKYADDCYRIFFVGDWKQVEPNDQALNKYHDWLWQNYEGVNSA